ncbi:hypothetical protein ROCKET24_133 [Vibrio phage Rocket24]|uniref:Tail fiber protein n=1 Tax=Vibrio phage Chester TaxID=2712961 RepID=A0A6G8R583_9CAUD|nr:tail fiber protein [Vibrio phage Chester]QIG66235.1 hypothetical protein CILSICK_136 [Vibrio phage Cilsick]WBF69485.1 hypothetical protein IW18_136 [Vibrio phage IW18]WBU77117.1 hypothetical protein NOELLE_133 [Vibrio phage Noelle]WCD55806.1 hypothetical protein ROCKET24_133 [Vibrio phage Rocket24]QIN96541.1 hypothetical protein CHESTER_138 [Vibrio phage Chester]
MQITVTKALTEIKKLDKQIAKLTQHGQFILVSTRGRVAGFTSVEEAGKAVKSNFDKIQALMKRRANIKAKVTASNAATKLTIAGSEMTVAEAIERKDSIEMEEHLLQVMKNQFNQAVNKQVRHEAQVQDEIDRKVEQVFGNAKKIDTNDGTYKAIREQVEAANKFELVDTNKLADQIEQLEDRIDDFRANVDVELSVSNATTSIEIDD